MTQGDRSGDLFTVDDLSIRPLFEMMPYLWPAGRPDLKGRVVLSFVFLILAKLATVAMPFFLGAAVDRLSDDPAALAIALPIALVVAYGFARVMMQGFAQIRDAIFAKVAYHAMRKVAVETFHHMHALSLRFQLDRRTGGLSRVIDRGTKAIDRLLSLALFNMFPTLLELSLIATILFWRFNFWFALITVAMIAAYMH